MSSDFGKNILPYVLIPLIAIGINSKVYTQNLQSQEPDKRVLNTIETLIKNDYKTLPCTTLECSTHLWKKNKDGTYSNVHQIGTTPYFAEAVNRQNIAANKKSGGIANMLKKFPEATLDNMDSNNDFKITNSEILKYRRKVLEKIKK